MTLPLGEKLKIRAMVYVAAEPIPFFWPMRSFIHHNPLHGLEDMFFEDAVARGCELFHARGFLSRSTYRRYLAENRVDRESLEEHVRRFVEGQPAVPGIELDRWLTTLMCKSNPGLMSGDGLVDPGDVQSALRGNANPPAARPGDRDAIKAGLHARMPPDLPVYEAVDALHGTRLTEQLDERVVKICLDFFDEGQSVWEMPERERGFFRAWRKLAGHDVLHSLRGPQARQVLSIDRDAEGVIAHVMQVLGIPEEHWVAYFTRELARLHGWAGFIRWRGTAGHYYWSKRYPADLVDYLAVRLTLSLALLYERGLESIPRSRGEILERVETRPCETFLRHELNGGSVLPALAHRVETTLAIGRQGDIDALCVEYLAQKRVHDGAHLARGLELIGRDAGQAAALKTLSEEAMGDLLAGMRAFEHREGLIWLAAVEARAIRELKAGITPVRPSSVDKRPFVQALFCIDTRSERIRRHLEGVGDYQTYGIAGFFGVPVSFVELGKGSETHLSPVLLTPRNLVIEMTAIQHHQEHAPLTALEKVLHELKESVLTPFVTVEAIGLLFGFDMIGKTLAPQAYNRWRNRMHRDKPNTHLLLDKLGREQADSIVRAVQRAVIEKAIEQELGLESERITDNMVRELREVALGHQESTSLGRAALGLDESQLGEFVEQLSSEYRINAAYARIQIERLGRIGFSLDEQVGFVSQALTSIGLTENMSRFVLLIGHGSSSENNPYESALDCGACGGNHGLVSARILAQMANKAQVRQRLKEKAGIAIPDDTWFVPAFHNTTTDELSLADLDLLPPSHVVYLDRLRNGLVSAARLCSHERLQSLSLDDKPREPAKAFSRAHRNAMDWSQVRPEWGLSQNAYFIIGRRELTKDGSLGGRAFLHSYDYRLDPKLRLLENILTGPLVVGQWINMEHYFSTVDSERFGSGSKVYHNVAGRFGVMSGNLSDLRTGLPTQTVLRQGEPYHEPLRLITLIEAPFERARRAIESVVAVKRLVINKWIRLLVLDPETGELSLFENGAWEREPFGPAENEGIIEELCEQ